MHELIDTELTDAYEEIFWSEDFKYEIREAKPILASKVFGRSELCRQIFVKPRLGFTTWESFINSLADLVIIGAENGADMMFDHLLACLGRGEILPSLLVPPAAPVVVECFPLDRILLSLEHGYRHEHVLEHVYEDYYTRLYPDFTQFTQKISDMMLVGITDQASKTIDQIFLQLETTGNLPRLRRQPKRVKTATVW